MKLLPIAALILFLPSVLEAQQQQPSSEQARPSQQTQPEETKPQETSTPAKNKGTPVVTNLAGFDLFDAKKLSGQTIVVAATRGAIQLVALAPRLGKLYGPNPTFAWSYEDTAAKFGFVLTDDAQAEVYRAEVIGTRIRYPASAPTLQAGRTYFWTVTVLGGLQEAASSSPSGVLVVSSARRQEINKKLAQHPGGSYEASVARAQVLTDYRLWYDVLAAITELIERFPDQTELYERRGTIYAQLDCTQALAEADFSRAERAKLKKK
jgi:hypothetical protein